MIVRLKNILSVAVLLLMPLQTPAAEWGLYQIYWQPAQFEKGLDQQLEQLGGEPTYAMFFRDLNPRRGFPTRAAEVCRARGLTPVISLELWDWHRSRNKKGLEEIIAGEHDAFFRNWASDAKGWGHPCLFRFGFEMNGDWFAWGQQPEAFKQAWRHVHGLFAEAGAENVQWMFAPNVLYETNTPLVKFEPYYPGDAYVDSIGLDGYNFGDDHSTWHEWTSAQTVFETSIDAASKWGKPLYLSEVGCADDPRKSEWVKEFLAWVKSDERVQGFIYFNYDKRSEGEPNWRLDSDEKSVAMFRSALGK